MMLFYWNMQHPIAVYMSTLMHTLRTKMFW